MVCKWYHIDCPLGLSWPNRFYFAVRNFLWELVAMYILSQPFSNQKFDSGSRLFAKRSHMYLYSLNKHITHIILLAYIILVHIPATTLLARHDLVVGNGYRIEKTFFFTWSRWVCRLDSLNGIDRHPSTDDAYCNFLKLLLILLGPISISSRERKC